MSGTWDLQALLDQTDWLHALARGLVRDESEADDLAQDTVISALRNRPAAQQGLRAWLGTVMRRHLLQRQRSDIRRRRREQGTARPEALAGTDRIVAQVELQRDLAQAVLQLDEPVRSAISLRFFEGLSQKEIAARTGCPTTTVNSRIQRGLRSLRSTLDTRFGERSRWLAALTPLAVASRPAANLTSATAGLAALMNSSLKLVAFGGITLAIVLWARSTEGPAPELPPGSPLDTAQADPAQLAQPSEASEPRRQARSAGAEDSHPEAMAAAQRTLRGQVLDHLGSPVAQVSLVVQGHPEIRSRSDATGAFAMRLPEQGGRLIVTDDPERTTLYAGDATATGGEGLLVVVAPRGSVHGTVRDAELREALAGARLHLRLRDDLDARIGRAFDLALPQQWSARSAADGSYRIDDLPAIPGATMEVSLDGYRSQGVALQPARSQQLDFELARPPAGWMEVLQGLVVDAEGTPVPRARVGLGMTTTRADAHGNFVLEIAEETERDELVAAAPGHLPAVIALPEDTAQFLVLRLGAAPLSIAGRVVDDQGEPIRSRVWLVDSRRFGEAEGTVLQVETISAGATLKFWPYVQTADDGTFTLGGLSDRTYKVAAFDEETFLHREFAIAAGSEGVELTLDRSVLWPEVRGVVVDRSGNPCSAVRISLDRILFEQQVRGGTYDRGENREGMVTDADGTFRFERVPPGMGLRWNGDAIMPGGQPLGDDAPTAPVQIVVERRMHFRVQHDSATTVRMLDAEDHPLLLRVMRGSGSHVGRSMGLADGHSQVISVSDRARTLVLYREGEEISRQAVALRPDQVNELR